MSGNWTFPACGCFLVSFLALGQPSPPRPARIVTEYALTSAQDVSNGDPQGWRLLGSNDDGRSWITLDIQTNQVSWSRSERRVFAVNNQTAYNAYRLQLDRKAEVALSELELMGPTVGVGSEADLHGIYTASGEQPLLAPASQAFDGDPTTKWVDFGIGGSEVCWLQCQYTLQRELPVTNLGQFFIVARRMAMRSPLLDKAPEILSNLTHQASKPLCTLRGYALSSANDNPCRDPRDWKLLGSNDGGKSWTTLDERKNEIFNTRFQKRSFALAHPAAYALYRLQIDSIRAPGADLADSVQLAEIEPLLAPGDPKDGITLVVSAQGENPPVEVATMAFDGDVKTKWLDFGQSRQSKQPGSNTNKASWIQWRYLAGTGPGVIDLRLLRTLRSRPPQPVKLEMEGVVVSWDPSTKTLGFLDDTGFQLFELASLNPEIRPGTRIRLSGQPRFGGEIPVVLKSEVDVFGPVPAVANIVAEQALDGSQSFLVGTAEGKVTSVSEGSAYFDLKLAGQDGSGSLTVRVLSPALRRVRFFPGCRVRASGVVQPVFDQNGVRAAGFLWAADLEHVQLACASEQDWKAWREYSAERLCETNRRVSIGGPVRLRGALVDESSGKKTIADKANHRVIVCAEDSSSGTLGDVIEAIGFLDREGMTPLLRYAQIRPVNGSQEPIAEEPAASVPVNEPLTQIREVSDFIQKEPGTAAPVQVRGVITYMDPGLGNFYLQEGEHGILVNGMLGAGLAPFLHQEGLYIEVRGEIATNQAAIKATSVVRVLGRGQMPEPTQHSWEFLQSGGDFSQWVAIEGVVREVGAHELVLALRGGKLRVQIDELDASNHERLLGSLVRICGVCAPVARNGSAQLGIRLLVHSMEQVQVLRQAPEDPFALPMRPISSLVRFGSERGVQGIRLVKTSGVVTYREPGLLFVQAGENGLRVAPRNDVLVEPGDQVEVVGFAEPDGFSPKLVQAVARKVGRGTWPRAIPIDLMNTELSGSDGKRGEIEGIFLWLTTRENLQILELRDDKLGNTFSAFFPTGHGVLPSMPAGSRVRLQGVFKAEMDPLQDTGELISSFSIFGNSPRDITILQRPSWWTARHISWTIGGCAGVLTVSLAWAGLLRRQVRRRTRELRAEIDERKQTEARLAYERHLLESLMEHSVDCIYFKDRDSRFLRCSRSLRERFAHGARDLIGKTDFDLFGGEHARLAFEDEQEIMRTGCPLIGKIEKELAHDGRESWALTTKMPLLNQGGEIVGTFGISKDITAIKQAEAELERTHKELVRASRVAGMAEVATNVLHNVGNVLNSINVAAALMEKRVKESRVAQVGRVAKLLEEHAADRVAFLTSDPKGQKVPDLIGQLAEKLEFEQTAMLEEISSLRRNVEHVNEIIAMQQSYARVSGVFENVEVTELLEDTLRMNEGSFARHDVKVVREFGALPRICTDKHKVLQILINLMRNAKYACDESGRKDKQVILRATNGHGRVSITVVDNGIGIPPENLARIFNHGFTTRKNGHGFGLHSGALAAKELGGSLTASSPGAGLGAVFTLELPCQPPAINKPVAAHDQPEEQG